MVAARLEIQYRGETKPIAVSTKRRMPFLRMNCVLMRVAGLLPAGWWMKGPGSYVEETRSDGCCNRGYRLGGGRSGRGGVQTGFLHVRD
jgi:hypothetical protein